MAREPKLPLTALRQKHVVDGRPVPGWLEQALEDDPRRGAQTLLASIRKKRRANRAEGQRLARMLRYETPLWGQGLKHIAGVDEAGMSPLAGPVVAAAVILPQGCKIRHVDDSKKLNAAVRDQLASEIKARAIAYAVGQVTPEEIDRLNIYHAGLLALRRAVEGLPQTAEFLLVDARPIALPIPQENIIKGDAKSLSIAAASIIAKTSRDNLMCDYDSAFPGYGFAKHKGYPVKQHVEALQRLGPTPIHRRSFRHVQEALRAHG